MRQETELTHRYTVTKPDGTFLAQWNDVKSEFEHIDEINTLGGGLHVSLGRSINNKRIDLTRILNSDGEVILNDEGQAIVSRSESDITVGEGTDVEVNDFLFVDEFYGYTYPWVNLDGEVITNDQGEEIRLSWGPVKGRRVFSGFISYYEPGSDADGDTIEIDALPFSTDLETSAMTVGLGFNISNYTTITSWQELARPTGAGLVDRVTQSFVATHSGLLSVFLRVRFTDRVAFPDARLNIALFSGVDPTSPSRVLLATGTKNLSVADVGSTTILGFRMGFATEASVVASSGYHIEVTSPDARDADGRAPFALAITGNNIASGQLHSRVDGAGYTSRASEDLYCNIFTMTVIRTRRTYANLDPGTFIYNRVLENMDLQDDRLKLGVLGDISPDIQRTNTTVPELSVNLNSNKEAIDLAHRASPTGWYYRYGQDTQRIHFQPPSLTPDHTFTRGVHLQSVKPAVNIESMANDIFFVGGIPEGETENTFGRYQDQESIERYGRKAKRISDLRYTDKASMDIVAAYELAQHKNPKLEASITVLDMQYDTGLIRVGHLVAFRGFATFIDSLQMVVTRRERKRGKVILRLGTVPITERRRLDEMRRAIAQIDAQNLPDEPS